MQAETNEGSQKVLEEVQPVIREDPTLFRKAQAIRPQVRDVDVLNKVVEEAKSYSISGEEIPKRLYEFVEQYQVSKKQPYSVDYFGAKEIYNDETKKDFEKIDEFIMAKLKEANQKTSLEAYGEILQKIEEALGLTKNSELFHRIKEIIKFISNEPVGST